MSAILVLLCAISDLHVSIAQRHLSGARMQPLRFMLQLSRPPYRLPLVPPLQHPHLHLRPCICLLILISLPQRCSQLVLGPIRCAMCHPSRFRIRWHTPTPGIIPRQCKRLADLPRRVRMHRARIALHYNGCSHTLVRGLIMVISQGRLVIRIRCSRDPEQIQRLLHFSYAWTVLSSTYTSFLTAL